MAPKSYFEKNPQLRMPVAGLLSWLLPGAGHVFIGERTRGIIIIAAITLTFWTGVAIGGVKHTVDRDKHQWWFIGQICAGGHALTAMAVGAMVEPAEGENPADLEAFNRAEEVSLVYTAICGMLGILVILDVLVRAEKGPSYDSAGAAIAGKKRGAQS